MEKKQPKQKQKQKQKTGSLALRKETLRRLEDAELRGAAGAGRVRIPGGFADDTTPIYIEVDEP